MTESNKVGSSGTERKLWKGKGFKPRKGGNKTNLSGNKRKRRKRRKAKRGKPGHFTRDCIEPKTQQLPTTYRWIAMHMWISIEFRREVGAFT